jgi:hypothetical protein
LPRGTQENNEALRIAGFLSEIWTSNLQNTKQEC